MASPLKLEQLEKEGIADGFVEDYYISKAYNGQDSVNNYITRLRDIVDTTTFELVRYCVFKDKNHVYIHTRMAYGGNLSVANSLDVSTIKTIASDYVCDKNHYFLYGREIKGVDVNTFRVLLVEETFVSRDKNTIYHWHEPMSEQDLLDFKAETGIDLTKL